MTATSSHAARVADAATARIADGGPFDPTVMHLTLGDLLHLSAIGENHLVARVLAAWGEAVDDCARGADAEAPGTAGTVTGSEATSTHLTGEAAAEASVPGEPAWAVHEVTDTIDGTVIHYSDTTAARFGDTTVETTLTREPGDVPRVLLDVEADAVTLDELRDLIGHLVGVAQRYGEAVQELPG